MSVNRTVVVVVVVLVVLLLPFDQLESSHTDNGSHSIWKYKTSLNISSWLPQTPHADFLNAADCSTLNAKL